MARPINPGGKLFRSTITSAVVNKSTATPIKRSRTLNHCVAAVLAKTACCWRSRRATNRITKRARAAAPSGYAKYVLS